jgi:hypothetical protein
MPSWAKLLQTLSEKKKKTIAKRITGGSKGRMFASKQEARSSFSSMPKKKKNHIVLHKYAQIFSIQNCF